MNYQVTESSQVVCKTKSKEKAISVQKQLHRENPFLYHEIYGPNYSSQLEPGDDPETGRAKWCYKRLNQKEADNGNSPECKACIEFSKHGMVHCPWNYASYLPNISVMQNIVKEGSGKQ